MIISIERSKSTMSLFVVVLLYTVLWVQQQCQDDNNHRVGVVVIEAFTTWSTPTIVRVTRWNHHDHARRSSQNVKRLLAKNLPDETSVTAITSEEKENAELSDVTTSPKTSDDTTKRSSKATKISNTEISTASPSSVYHVDCDEDDTSEECVLGSEDILGECLPEKLVTLPIHTTSQHVHQLLRNTEQILRNMHINSTVIEMSQILAAKEAGRTHECIYANNYVDLGKIDTYVIGPI